ncbi:MAG: UDP-N-acetylmuramate dehydrogenase [Candidatus Omnitrophota bacterium]|nr:UDP-N-acetylmuramate dehydrogenase [Candidatus Omnitrophota bacterium]
MNWPKESRIRTNYPLKNNSTFRIGGCAQFFCEPKDTAELKLLIKIAGQNKLPVFILGAGSNLVISDKGVRGLVIKLGSPYFKRISLEKGNIRVGSGAALAQLIKFSRDKSLQGAEFLSGIPGTAGGGLAMNAGCWGSVMGNLVKEAEVMDKGGRIKNLKRSQIKFVYRKSSLAKYIILSSLLSLKQGKAREIEKNIKKYLGERRKSQDLTWPNAGCIFKNPENNSAGRLIELCGLKGRHVGGAYISERHANFILNKGNASAKDVLRLMRITGKQVKDKFKLLLEPEIKIWK